MPNETRLGGKRLKQKGKDHARGAERERGLVFLIGGDGEAEAEGVQERVEAAELGVAAIGEHAVQAFAVKLGRLGEPRDSTLSLGDVP